MSNIRYGSVCSGIEAATVAWHDLGWEAQWFSEIEKFPSAVLAHHYPSVPNLGDMTLLTKNPIFNERPIDLLVGGTPCQSFSVAGLRHGLADSRGNLSLEYCRLLISKQPKWFVWENVPGVLSSAGGADFASILSAFTGRSIKPQKFGKSGLIQGDPDSDNGAGYSIAYRVLDSQYFGVPQRRRRVFVIGHLGGDWRPPAAVLLERESLCRDFTPRREPRQEATGFTPTSFGGYGEGVGTLKKSGGDLGGGSETLFRADIYNLSISKQSQTLKSINASAENIGAVVEAKWPADTASTLNASFGDKQGLENQHINSGAPLFVPQSYGIPGNWIGRKPENGGNAVEPMHNVAPCQTKTDKHAVVYGFDSLSSNSMKSSNPHSGVHIDQVVKTLDTTHNCPSKNQGGNAVVQSYGIQGSMVGRSEANGPQGGGVNEETSFTLNTTDRHCAAYVFDETQINSPVNASNPKPEECHTLPKGGRPPTLFYPHGIAENPETAHCLRSGASKADKPSSTTYVTQPLILDDQGGGGGVMNVSDKGIVGTLRRETHGHEPIVLTTPTIRRLTPIECERLQGFPDGYTLIPKAADGPRYKALGNSMTTNVMKWIGERIEAVNTLLDVL